MKNPIKLYPCPRCGCWLLASGRASSLKTPRLVRLWRRHVSHGITCCLCGYYAPSIKAWNRRARNE